MFVLGAFAFQYPSVRTVRTGPYDQVNLAGRDDYRDGADTLRERLEGYIAALESETPPVRPAEHHCP